MRRRRTPTGRQPSLSGFYPRKGQGVSLVVAVTELRPAFEAGLAAVVPECAEANIEVVVACSAPRRSLDALRRRHPRVRFSATEGAASLAQLRTMGMRQANGDFVIFLDDSAGEGATARASSLLAAAVARLGGGALADSASPPRTPLLARLWSANGNSRLASSPSTAIGGDGNGRSTPASHVIGD